MFVYLVEAVHIDDDEDEDLKKIYIKCYNELARNATFLGEKLLEIKRPSEFKLFVILLCAFLFVTFP